MRAPVVLLRKMRKHFQGNRLQWDFSFGEPYLHLSPALQQITFISNRHHPVEPPDLLGIRLPHPRPNTEHNVLWAHSEGTILAPPQTYGETDPHQENQAPRPGNGPRSRLHRSRPQPLPRSQDPRRRDTDADISQDPQDQGPVILILFLFFSILAKNVFYNF